MSSEFCQNCGCSIAWHVDEGPCRMLDFESANEPCDCEAYEPGDRELEVEPIDWLEAKDEQ